MIIMQYLTVSIPVQSISDIITNSSSELFCIIGSDDLYPIYELLETLFEGDDPEIEPSIYWINSNDESEIGYFGDIKPCPRIEIWIPYNCCDLTTFFEAGITALLNQKFGSNTYTIEFKDNERF